MTETTEAAARLLESLDRHFLAGCPSLSTSQLEQHRATGTCPDCTEAVAFAAIKVVVSEAQPPGTIGMVSHGPDFTSVAACVLTDPPVVKAKTIRHGTLKP